MQPASLIPVPYFVIDEHFAILDSSDSARGLFGEGVSFLDLVDVDSRSKAAALIRPDASQSEHVLELNLNTATKSLQLFGIHQKWDANLRHGHLVCLLKTEEVDRLAAQIERVRNELLQEKTAALSPNQRTASRWLEQSRDGLREQIALHATTIRDLLHVLRPTLLEENKAYYLQLIETELDAAEELLAKKAP